RALDDRRQTTRALEPHGLRQGDAADLERTGADIDVRQIAHKHVHLYALRTRRVDGRLECVRAVVRSARIRAVPFRLRRDQAAERDRTARGQVEDLVTPRLRREVQGYRGAGRWLERRAFRDDQLPVDRDTGPYQVRPEAQDH